MTASDKGSAPGPRQAPQQPLRPQTATVREVELQYVVAGEGHPHLVLENGAGVPVAGWEKLAREGLLDIGTVLAYSRPGVRGSGRPTRPQTADEILATLRNLLEIVGLTPPYLLVGHSLGGLYVNLFARLYPAEVSGVVFLEAAHPQDPEQLKSATTPLSRALQSVSNAFAKRRPGNDLLEMAFVKQTAAQVEAAGPFPRVPVAVITGAKRPPRLLFPPHMYEVRLANQERLAALSPHSRHIMAGRSSHFPQITEPQLVLDAIRRVAAEAGQPETAGGRAAFPMALATDADGSDPSAAKIRPKTDSPTDEGSDNG